MRSEFRVLGVNLREQASFVTDQIFEPETDAHFCAHSFECDAKRRVAIAGLRFCCISAEQSSEWLRIMPEPADGSKPEPNRPHHPLKADADARNNRNDRS